MAIGPAVPREYAREQAGVKTPAPPVVNLQTPKRRQTLQDAGKDGSVDPHYTVSPGAGSFVIGNPGAVG
jgi:hypothetical protein